MFPEYIRLIVSRLGLPSDYDYWLAEHSPIIPQESITQTSYLQQTKNYATAILGPKNLRNKSVNCD